MVLHDDENGSMEWVEHECARCGTPQIVFQYVLSDQYDEDGNMMPQRMSAGTCGECNRRAQAWIDGTVTR